MPWLCPSSAIGLGLVKSMGHTLSGGTSRYTSREGFAIIDPLISSSWNNEVLLDLDQSTKLSKCEVGK